MTIKTTNFSSINSHFMRRQSLYKESSIVMNAREEINQAIQDYQNNQFV